MIQSLHIYGSFYSKGAEHLYTYVAPGTTAPDVSVNNYIFDFRSYVGFVSQCYALWCTAEGWWISVLAINKKHDDRQGLVEVAFCLGKNRPKNGAEAVKFLDCAINDFVHNKPAYYETQETTKIENFGPSQHFWNDAETQQWLEAHPLELVPYTQCRPFTLGEMPTPVYRAYATPDELASALNFLSQSSYGGACRVFLVPSDEAEKVVGMKRIVETLKRIFTIECPSGVQCNQPEANEGDRLTVTYTKSGFEPIIEHIAVGDTSRGSLNGTTYTLNSAEQLRLPFKKRVYIICRGNGLEISDVKVLCNGSELKKDEATNHFYYDASEGVEKVKVSVTHSDYKKNEAEHRINKNRQEITIDLKQKDYNVIFEVGNLQFSAGSISKGSTEFVTLEKHGAQISDSSVRVKVGSSSASPYGVGSTGGRAPQPVDKSDLIEDLLEWKNTVIKGATFVVIGIFLCYGLYALGCWLEVGRAPWPFNQELKDSTIVDSTATLYPAEEDSVKQKEQEQFETEDTTYLKREDTWKKSALKSDKYKMLIDFITNGQIDDILACEWFLEGGPVNGYWLSIAEYLRQAQDPTNKSAVADIVKANAGRGENVTLSNMKDQLQGFYNHRNASGGGAVVPQGSGGHQGDGGAGGGNGRQGGGGGSGHQGGGGGGGRIFSD